MTEPYPGPADTDPNEEVPAPTVPAQPDITPQPAPDSDGDDAA